MRKTACAIVQDNDGWYGLALTATDREISDVKVYTGRTFGELSNLFGKQPYGVALDDAAGYLFNLTLPFRGRRKIGLALGGQLEEMLPFPIEEMIIDFQELGDQGCVLAAAIPRSTLTDLAGRRQIANVTLKSLAALYAIKCFKLLPQEKTLFLDCTGSSTVIMVFEDQRLAQVRHFIRSPQADATVSALKEIAEQTDVSDARYLMVAGDDGFIEKQAIERALGIDIELLSLSDYITGENLREQSWAGVGSALMALNPKGEINLSGEHYRSLSDSSRTSLYITGALAGASLLALSLSSLDLYLKQRTLSVLSSEPNRIYRTAFPKAPPVKDTVRVFEERIESLVKAEGGKENEDTPLFLLNEISSRIKPQIDVRLSEFIADEKEFAIAGTTVSFVSIDKIRDAVQQIKGAGAVELQSIDRITGGQVRFKLRGRL